MNYKGSYLLKPIADLAGLQIYEVKFSNYILKN